MKTLLLILAMLVVAVAGPVERAQLEKANMIDIVEGKGDLPLEIQTPLVATYVWVGDNDEPTEGKGERIGKISGDVIEFLNAIYPITCWYMSKDADQQNEASMNIFTSDYVFILHDLLDRSQGRYMMMVIPRKSQKEIIMFVIK